MGSLAEDLRVTPHFPVGVTPEEFKAWGRLANFTDWDFQLIADRTGAEHKTFCSGVMTHLLAQVDRRSIQVETGTAITGSSRTGTEPSTSTAELTEKRGPSPTEGVLLAISGYDWPAENVDRYESIPAMMSATRRSSTETISTSRRRSRPTSYR